MEMKKTSSYGEVTNEKMFATFRKLIIPVLKKKRGITFSHPYFWKQLWENII